MLLNLIKFSITFHALRFNCCYLFTYSVWPIWQQTNLLPPMRCPDKMSFYLFLIIANIFRTTI